MDIPMRQLPRYGAGIFLARWPQHSCVPVDVDHAEMVVAHQLAQAVRAGFADLGPCMGLAAGGHLLRRVVLRLLVPAKRADVPVAGQEQQPIVGCVVDQICHDFVRALAKRCAAVLDVEALEMAAQDVWRETWHCVASTAAVMLVNGKGRYAWRFTSLQVRLSSRDVPG
jgi:hypothetical protein